MRVMIKTKKQSGFTIVELLIVIVVIGILAAITVVAYSGVQQRANSSKTVTALGAWIKALSLYKVDNGRWPGTATCLGEGYLYGVSGSDASGIAQCRQDSVGGGVVENASFKVIMAPYIKGVMPTPAFVTARSSDSIWRRGLSYTYGGGDGTQVYVLATFAGTGGCPVVSGFTGSANVWDGNTWCVYLIGRITDT